MMHRLILMTCLLSSSGIAGALDTLESSQSLLPFPSTITLYTSVSDETVLMVKTPQSETYEFVSTISPLAKYYYYEPKRAGSYSFILVRDGETLGTKRVRTVSKPTLSFELPEDMFQQGNYPVALNTNCPNCKVLTQIEYQNKIVARHEDREFTFTPQNVGIYQFHGTVFVPDPTTGLDSLALSAEYRESVNVRKPYSISAFINFPSKAKLGELIDISLIVPGLTKSKECYIRIEGQPFYGCGVELEGEEWNDQLRLYIEAKVTSADSYHIPTTAHMDLIDPLLEQDNISVEYLGQNLYLVSTEIGQSLSITTNDEALEYTRFGQAILFERNMFRQYEFTSLMNGSPLAKLNINERSAKDLSVSIEIENDKNNLIAPMTLKLKIDVSKFDKNNIRSIQLFNNGKPLLVQRSRIAYQITESGPHRFDLILTTRQGIQFTDSIEVFVQGNVPPSCEIQTNIDDNYFNARCIDQDGYIQSVEWFVDGKSVSNRRKIPIPDEQFGYFPRIRFQAIDNLNAIRSYTYDNEKQTWITE